VQFSDQESELNMLTPEFDPKPITATKIIDTLKQKTPSEMREFKINTSVQEANP
jgi:hypothetical protein